MYTIPCTSGRSLEKARRLNAFHPIDRVLRPLQSETEDTQGPATSPTPNESLVRCQGLGFFSDHGQLHLQHRHQKHRAVASKDSAAANRHSIPAPVKMRRGNASLPVGPVCRSRVSVDRRVRGRHKPWSRVALVLIKETGCRLRSVQVQMGSSTRGIAWPW